jgi:septum formation protein
MRLTLASASPRRRDLLGWLGVSFDTLVTDAEERPQPLPPVIAAALPPLGLAERDHPSGTAARKAIAACAEANPGVIIGADTIVVLGEQVLNKPQDADEARAMLRALAGSVHTVYTGLALLVTPKDARGPIDGAIELAEGRLLLDLVEAQVRIAELRDEQIAAYVATGEPLDKAGAYGIQGLGGRLVAQVVGSYTAVVGLPLPATAQLLRRAGVTVPVDAADAYHAWLRAQGKEPLPCPPTLP